MTIKRFQPTEMVENNCHYKKRWDYHGFISKPTSHLINKWVCIFCNNVPKLSVVSLEQICLISGDYKMSFFKIKILSHFSMLIYFDFTKVF